MPVSPEQAARSTAGRIDPRIQRLYNLIDRQLNIKGSAAVPRRDYRSLAKHEIEAVVQVYRELKYDVYLHPGFKYITISLRHAISPRHKSKR